jgi:hypothetical protein
MHFAHERGILPRYQAETLLDKGRAASTDFGLARLIEQENTITFVRCSEHELHVA